MRYEDLHWTQMAFRQYFIGAIEKEIRRSHIQILSTAEDIEFMCYSYGNLAVYLQKLSEVIIKIRSDNKRIMPLKREKYLEQTQDDVLKYLRCILMTTLEEEMKKISNRHYDLHHNRRRYG